MVLAARLGGWQNGGDCREQRGLVAFHGEGVGTTSLTDDVGRDADTPDDWSGMVGALRAENASTYACPGRHGEAWRHWESAYGIARKLGPGYRHVQTSFGLPVMKANAVTLGVDLRRGGEAMQGADFDPADIASVPRRARHMIEVARVHALQGDQAAVFAMLDQAERTAPETARFNG